jgi:hypothetical protein
LVDQRPASFASARKLCRINALPSLARLLLDFDVVHARRCSGCLERKDNRPCTSGAAARYVRVDALPSSRLVEQVESVMYVGTSRPSPPMLSGSAPCIYTRFTLPCRRVSLQLALPVSVVRQTRIDAGEQCTLAAVRLVNGRSLEECDLTATVWTWPVSDARLADTADRWLTCTGHPSTNGRCDSSSRRSAH